jgi:putative tricarboxylic transport membrane protein
MTRLMGEILTACGMIVAAVYVIVVASEFPAGGDIMPVFCAIGVIVLSFFMLLEVYLKKRYVIKDKINFSANYSALKPYILLALSIIYFIFIFVFGYYSSTILFLFISSYILGVRRAKFIFITSIILLPAMYAFFELFLQARLPSGWLL